MNTYNYTMYVLAEKQTHILVLFKIFGRFIDTSVTKQYRISNVKHQQDLIMQIKKV